jgi:DNA-directed RNA polymerase specialized sigma24 family protein
LVQDTAHRRVRIARERLDRDASGTPAAFSQFLSWLDEGVESNGEKYLEMRRRLVAYFDRKGCPEADELTDETLNRVARRLEEEGAITGTAPAQYCYITAKFVFLEYLRDHARFSSSLTEMSPVKVDAVLSRAALRDDSETKERRSVCLDRCMENLSMPDRQLILEYYQGEQRTKIESRRDLATSLRLSVNALSIRACRIRNKLELCVRECSGKP